MSNTVNSGARVWAFLALAVSLTWSMQWPAVLMTSRGAEAPGGLQLLAGLGIFGPLLAAVTMAWFGPGSVRDLFGQLFRWRADVTWYLFALLLPATLLTIGLAVSAPSPAP